MRILALWQPRLGIQLALRQRPTLEGRPVILLQGRGEEALVSEASCEAQRMGVLRGVSAGHARGRCPGGVFLADNAGGCLDEMGRIASIIRTRATTRVAIGGTDHLFVGLPDDLDGAQEAVVAKRLLSLAAAWGGQEARGGVADSRDAALDAAHAARRGVLIVPSGSEGRAVEEIPVYRSGEQIGAAVRLGPGESGLAARAAVIRLFGRLQLVLAARGESFRELEMEVETGAGAIRHAVASAQPLHTAGEGLALLGTHVPADALAGARQVRVLLGRLGPNVRVARRAAGVGRPAGRIAPAALRRAS